MYSFTFFSENCCNRFVAFIFYYCWFKYWKYRFFPVFMLLVQMCFSILLLLWTTIILLDMSDMTVLRQHYFFW